MLRRCFILACFIEDSSWSALALQLPQPKVLLGKTLKFMTQLIQPESLIPEEERPRLINSVVQFQSMSVRQGGLRDIRFTAGDTETSLFSLQQIAAKKLNEPYFMKVCL